MPLVSSLATKVRDGGSFTSKGIGCGGGSVAWEGVASLRKRRRRLVVYRRSGWRGRLVLIKFAIGGVWT